MGSIGITLLFTTGFIKPISTVSEDQLAVDEKMIRLHGQQFWLYGAVDPYTNETLYMILYPTENKQTTRWFLTELHQRYQLYSVEFLVDDEDYLGPVLSEDGYHFKLLYMEIGMPSNVSFGKAVLNRHTAAR